MTKAKSCPPGKYWCYTDKKCKKVPMGYYVGRGGYLSKENEDGEEGKKNGIYVRTLGNIVMLVPPLAITEQELDSLIQRAIQTIKSAKNQAV